VGGLKVRVYYYNSYISWWASMRDKNHDNTPGILFTYLQYTEVFFFPKQTMDYLFLIDKNLLDY